jgi:TRAP-type transport system periplasmic protein
MTPHHAFRRLAAIAAAATLVAGAASAQSLEFRIGMVTPPSHVWTQMSNRFAEEIAEATDGEITVSVFPAGQLGNETEMLQQFQADVLEMGIFTAGTLSTRVPDFSGWLTPFAFDDVSAAIEAAETEAAQEMLAALEPQGIRGMGYIFAGMRHILMASREVQGINDLRNQKIRILPFPAAQTWWNAAGAVPTPVQLGDVYQALNTGLLDGVDIDLDAMVGFSMQQVASQLVFTNHMAFPGIVLITQSAWDRMSEEQQEIFARVLAENIAWGNELQITMEGEHLARVEEELTVTRLENPAEVFSAANEAFHGAYGDLPLVQRFHEEIGH